MRTYRERTVLALKADKVKTLYLFTHHFTNNHTTRADARWQVLSSSSSSSSSWIRLEGGLVVPLGILLGMLGRCPLSNPVSTAVAVAAAATAPQVPGPPGFIGRHPGKEEVVGGDPGEGDVVGGDPGEGEVVNGELIIYLVTEVKQCWAQLVT